MAGNIFGASDDKSKTEFGEQVDVHSKAILSVTQRQKDIESNLDLFNEKIELLDHNAISTFKKINTDVKSLRDDIHDVHEELKELKDFNSKAKKQLKLMSTKDEVAKLEKYIDLWSPMDFATRDEVQKVKIEMIDAIKDIISDFLEGNDEKLKESLSKKKDNKSE